MIIHVLLSTQLFVSRAGQESRGQDGPDDVAQHKHPGQQDPISQAKPVQVYIIHPRAVHAPIWERDPAHQQPDWEKPSREKAKTAARPSLSRRCNW